MNAWLVINHFLKSEKFAEISNLLMAAAHDRQIELAIKTNYELSFMIFKPISQTERPDFVLFWNKDIRLARLLEAAGLKLYNSADAIEICDDKARTYTHMSNNGLKMPKTLIAPQTYHNIDWGAYDIIDAAEDIFGYPLVLKESIGSYGDQVYLLNSREELVNGMNSIGCRPMMLQEFIQTSKGRDIRIYIVGNQVAAAVYRYSETDDFRANLTRGAKMRRYEPNKQQIQMALDAVKSIGLDFAGVDILFGNDDEPILCEVNSNAHFKKTLECTGVNVAEHIMDYIVDAMHNAQCTIHN